MGSGAPAPGPGATSSLEHPGVERELLAEVLHLAADAGEARRVLDAPSDEAVLARVRAEVKELCGHFPMYEDRQ